MGGKAVVKRRNSIALIRAEQGAESAMVVGFADREAFREAGKCAGGAQKRGFDSGRSQGGAVGVGGL